MFKFTPSAPIIFNRDRQILFREYGRNIQVMVHHIAELDDRAKRTQLARTTVELMRMLNPQPGNDTVEFYQKLWDHLHIMGNFALDVESPFPVPTPEKLAEKPQPLRPAGGHVKFRSYGRNLELMVKKATAIEDEEERFSAILFIGRLIKTFYANMNKETLEDKSILRILGEMSNGKLTLPPDALSERESLFVVGRNVTPLHNFQQERGEGGTHRNEGRQQGNNQGSQNQGGNRNQRQHQGQQAQRRKRY